MACSSCKNRRRANNTTQFQEKETNSLYETGEFQFVRYNGPSYTHNIGSRTGIIRNFGMTDYGRGKKGVVILVHNSDIRASKETFEVLREEELSKVLEELNLVRKTVAKENVTSEKKEITKESDVKEETKTEATAEKEEKREEKRDGLTKAQAVKLTEYAEQNGYTHYLQVVAKVKAGELFSYKDEDGSTMIYEREGE